MRRINYKVEFPFSFCVVTTSENIDDFSCDHFFFGNDSTIFISCFNITIPLSSEMYLAYSFKYKLNNTKLSALTTESVKNTWNTLVMAKFKKCEELSVQQHYLHEEFSCQVGREQAP